MMPDQNTIAMTALPMVIVTHGCSSHALMSPENVMRAKYTEIIIPKMR